MTIRRDSILQARAVQRHVAAAGARGCARLRAARSGFTLIELILVLALLAIATSLIAPSLSRFFRERALSAEARQVLSVAHAAQSRAIAEGFPVLLWLDSEKREYGLQMEDTLQQGATASVDAKAESFVHDENVKIEALDADPMNMNGRSVHAIRFLPDGMADEKSPTRLRMTSSTGDVLWLVQSTNRLGYAISSTQF